jgi:hypothetical protein
MASNKILLRSPQFRITGFENTYEFDAVNLPVAINPLNFSLGVAVENSNKDENESNDDALSVELMDIFSNYKIGKVTYSRNFATRRVEKFNNPQEDFRSFKAVIKTKAQSNESASIRLVYLIDLP